jgi:hypothetical protein
MQSQAQFGFKDMLTQVIGDMARAMCRRNDESEQRQRDRVEAAVRMIMGFLPRDLIEAMLAGHCVMFHELMVDNVRHTLLGEVDTMRRSTRASVVAMDKCFGNNLTRLEHYQRRPSTGSRETADTVAVETPAETPMETPIEAPVATAAVATPRDASLRTAMRTEFATAGQQAGAATERTPEPQGTAAPPARTAATGIGSASIGGPSASAIADCQANPEAMAALDAGDPARFARALGLEPNAAFLAAATAPGGPFDRAAAGPPAATRTPVGASA